MGSMGAISETCIFVCSCVLCQILSRLHRMPLFACGVCHCTPGLLCQAVTRLVLGCRHQLPLILVGMTGYRYGLPQGYTCTYIICLLVLLSRWFYETSTVDCSYLEHKF